MKIPSSTTSTSGEKVTSRISSSNNINIVSRTNTIETDNSKQCDVMLNNSLGAFRVEGEESFVALVDTNNTKEDGKNDNIMDTLNTTVTVSDMHEIVGCHREACKFEYTTYPKWKLEESIRKTQIYLVNLRSFKSNCLPSAKRLKYAKAYGRFSAIPDNEDSEDYTDFSSDE